MRHGRMSEEGDEHKKNPSNIALIDGECFLCHNLTAFAVKHDKKRKLHFATLQSPAGRRLLGGEPIGAEGPRSFLLVRNGVVYSRSGAVLRAAAAVGGWFSLLYLFIIVPAPLRNWAYDWVAKNRYRWFGKSTSCLMPSEDVKSRFLKDGLH